VFAGVGPALEGGPIAIAPDGSVLMTGAGPFEGVESGTLLRIDLATGTSTVLFRKKGFGFEGLAVAPDGTIFVVANEFLNRQHMLIRFNPATGQQTAVFSRPDILLNRIVLTARGEPLLTGRVWPNTDPSRGLLLRLDPGGPAGADWPVHEVSAGGLLTAPGGLAIVPPAAG
jgi:streptogramin lyase